MTPEEYSQKEAELLSRIPKNFHAHFCYLAYEEGHHSGYENILAHLRNYVEAIELSLADAKLFN